MKLIKWCLKLILPKKVNLSFCLVTLTSDPLLSSTEVLSWWPWACPGTLRSLTVPTATCLWWSLALWRRGEQCTVLTAMRSSSPLPAPAASRRSWGWVTYFRRQYSILACPPCSTILASSSNAQTHIEIKLWHYDSNIIPYNPLYFFTGSHQCPEADMACVLLPVCVLPAANQKQHLPHGGWAAILRKRWAVTASKVFRNEHDFEINQITKVTFHWLSSTQIITNSLVPVAMVVTSPSRPETSFWRRWDSPGMIPASYVQ